MHENFKYFVYERFQLTINKARLNLGKNHQKRPMKKDEPIEGNGSLSRSGQILGLHLYVIDAPSESYLIFELLVLEEPHSTHLRNQFQFASSFKYEMLLKLIFATLLVVNVNSEKASTLD